MPKNVQIDASKIRDWDSFHDHFSEALGFPEFYGRNMNAWVDCMTYLDDPTDAMTTIHVEPGAVLVLLHLRSSRSQEEMSGAIRRAD